MDPCGLLTSTVQFALPLLSSLTLLFSSPSFPFVSSELGVLRLRMFSTARCRRYRVQVVAVIVVVITTQIPASLPLLVATRALCPVLWVSTALNAVQ